MAGVKKFGAFAGVYTPSVLTILGVIMYMRLGWVVGQAGLIGAIVIILVAHIISISTSLSISSIATDKKIKTGGIYYILSRSLGLPMGGSIGITLFVGTALSIALYIVGFTENFLGIEAISNFLGMESGINSIRIIGTIVLVLLVAIAFISTSLAIKSQFFVLGAIALSLISIVLGFAFVDPSAMPEVAMSPADGHFPIITIFAIFFPAVTGFTAGVAMSGDLSDPKKSIPRGTMYAVATGLIVYVLLAIGIAYFVDRETLLTDNNFLLKIAIYSPFVVAGIWGATLSSALGGILGAPRIIQAIANDKIIPRFLGKGYGASNEPRNALLFTFVIAEMGILIGDLDAIAEVVSMFYIAAYGFINLAFALESWASSDFRPSFSVNKWIGIIGFIASFGVMLQLNPGAMVAAFVIMWFIYFMLKRKELKSDFGDVWGSVWSSVVRTSITRLSEKSLEKRNWKPNILMFSGSTNDRPHLLEVGKQLVGKYGFLSHFDLKVNPDKNFTFTKREQLINNEEQSKGIFSRRQSVSDLYDGIEQISSTYGFVGVEPNTIFLGWARNTKEPVRFAQMLKNLYRLDQNVILMDYDDRYGFGDRKQIDIWWRGKGQNGNLSLQLAKFLQESEDWSKTKLRLLVVNSVNSEHENIYRQAKNILSNLRIDGEVRIINNQIEKKSFYDIVQLESINSSLIFMGLPDIEDKLEQDFVDKTNELCHKIGTVILVRASSNFMEMNIGRRKKQVSLKSIFAKAKLTELVKKQEEEGLEINYPKYENLKYANEDLYNSISEIQSYNNEHFLQLIAENESVVLQDFEASIKKSIDSMKMVIESSKAELLSSKISIIHTKLFKEIKEKILNLQDAYLPEQNILLNKFVKKELTSIKGLYQSLPANINISYDLEDIQTAKGDSFDVRWYKAYNRLLAKFGKKKFKYRIRYKHLLIEHFLEEHLSTFDFFLHQYGISSSENIVAIEMFVTEMDKEVQKLYQKIVNSEKEFSFDKNYNRMHKLLKDLEKGIVNRMIQFLKLRESSLSHIINNLNKISSQVDVNSSLDDEFNLKRAISKISLRSTDLPDMRFRNQNMLINHMQLNTNLLIFSNQLRQFSNLIYKRVKSNIERDIVSNHSAYLKYLKSYYKRLQKNKTTSFNFDATKLVVAFDKIAADNLVNLILKTQKAFMKNLPKSIEIFTEESDNLIGTEQQYDDLKSVNLSVVRLMDYLIQDEYSSKLQAILTELPDKIIEQNNKLHDHLRLITYNIENRDVNNDDFATYIQNEIQSLENESIEIGEFANDTLMQIEERQRIIGEKISIYPFMQAAMNLKQYIKQREIKAKSTQMLNWKNQFYKWLRNKGADLWYSQSKTMILTQELLEEQNDILHIQKNQRDAIEKLNASTDVMEKLPFYYRQLFANRHNYMSEFWVERKHAEQELNSFTIDYDRGLSRGLLISGLPGSGKSFLSYKLSSSLKAGTKVYSIIPPEKGSTTLAAFNRALRATFELDEGTDYFKNVKKNSLIIFEDSELWWRRTADGFKVIDQIHNIISKNCSDYLFVVVMNNFTHKYISQLRPLNAIYTHYISLGAVDARSLENMIWKRHIAGGLNLKLGNKEQGNFHSWDFARLFGKYFRFSKGYPSVAMEAWLNNIISIEDNGISIKAPQSFDISIFDTLEDSDLWMLQLFVLHKHMDYSKMSLVSGLNVEVVIRKLFELQRIGFIENISGNVYRLSPILLTYIIQVLKTKKYL